MIEIWKPVVGYEGLYEVSNWGRVKSLYDGRRNIYREKILKGILTKKGYLQVCLYKDSTKKWHRIHQLVAKAYIPNPNNYTIVHHKNKEDYQNNAVWNLEWISKEDHDRLHGIEKAVVFSKTVYQYTLDWELVKAWESTAECGRNGFNQGDVAACCRGEIEQYKGYRWSYVLL